MPGAMKPAMDVTDLDPAHSCSAEEGLTGRAVMQDPGQSHPSVGRNGDLNPQHAGCHEASDGCD